MMGSNVRSGGIIKNETNEHEDTYFILQGKTHTLFKHHNPFSVLTEICIL